LAGKLQKRKFRTYVLMGDSESAEGSVWEAVELAAHYELKNLCLIIDVNRLGQRGETMLGHKTKSYKERFESFGWQAEIIDGYDVVEIRKAFLKAKKSNKPVAIIAKTFKGEGVSFLKDKNGWHGKTLDEEELKKALKEIPDPEMPKIEIRKPGEIKFKDLKVSKYKIKNYKKGEMVATREAYGSALSGLALADSKVIAVDAEVSNSTFSAEIKNVKPAQFVEAFIAEQAMVGIVLGLSKKGFDVFGSTFSAFLSRAHDQIRMSALSNGKFTLCGSHCGTSIGEDGASQMGLEDISMMRALPNSIVFYPSDAVSTEKLVCLSSKLNGIKYIRTTRPKTKVIYKNSERFEVGDFKILKQGKKDKIVLVGSGITLHETLKAHEKIKDSAVVDLYCVKPFNSEKFIEFVKNHGGKVVVAEDNYAEGGIGEMLSSVLVGSGIKMKSLAVREIPHSGKGNELLEKYGIDLRAIIGTAKKII